MHIWTITNWEKRIDIQDGALRKGLRLRFDKEVDPEVKRACKEFCAWLRKNYFFPKRVVIYFKRQAYIQALDGELVSATFFAPIEYSEEPYIRIATGDYPEFLAKNGQDNALASMLGSIVHELTHYFQWINALSLTPLGEERQAKAYIDFLLDEYQETRKHP
ncbi:MAG: hypothetical protein CVV04_12200 [Firmicutes bacterium HGW-Firmicutes-9]|jgi:hypothetical protein|nr:MAG: hypothetical protein CVV04_12200 [Firmicutes bacterium HGW-Firmicutes-9]